jgi:hypothetical protein
LNINSKSFTPTPHVQAEPISLMPTYMMPSSLPVMGFMVPMQPVIDPVLGLKAIMENILEFNYIERSSYLMGVMDSKDLSIHFDSLFQEP